MWVKNDYAELINLALAQAITYEEDEGFVDDEANIYYEVVAHSHGANFHLAEGLLIHEAEDLTTAIAGHLLRGDVYMDLTEHLADR